MIFLLTVDFPKSTKSRVHRQFHYPTKKDPCAFPCTVSRLIVRGKRINNGTGQQNDRPCDSTLMLIDPSRSSYRLEALLRYLGNLDFRRESLYERKQDMLKRESV